MINGAQRVSGWTLTNPSKEIWSAAVPPGLTTRQIYVDGVRASLTTGRSPVGLKQTRMGYIATAPTMAGWRNPSGIEFVYTSEISLNTEAICPIGTIVGASITMAQPCWANSTRRRWNGVGFNSVNTPTYVEDAYEMLDQPGQFYLDSAAHRLYYIPRQGQDMQSADVEVPVLQTLVTGDGTSRAPIHNITFANLQFSYATWLQPSTPEGFSEIQTGYTVTGLTGYAKQGLCHLAPGGSCPYGTWSKEPGNIHFRYARDLWFLNDRFVHLGAAGLSLGDGSQYDNVEECVFTDISGNGLEIGDVDLPNAKANSQTIGNTVTNNHLYGIPVEYHGGVPILVGYAAHTLISHNQIDHTPYAGISLGWGGWLDKDRQPPVPNFSHDNLISNNLIFDFMQDLKDGGGVYTQGIQGWSMSTGLKITGNVIHNQLDWGGALKADNGTTYVTYARNVFTTTHMTGTAPIGTTGQAQAPPIR